MSFITKLKMNWKLNWKLRFKNKTTLVALLAAVVAFVYQILDIFNVVPIIGENSVLGIGLAVITILVVLGIVTDPTTAGVADSRLALTYEEPRLARRTEDLQSYIDYLNEKLKEDEANFNSTEQREERRS